MLSQLNVGGYKNIFFANEHRFSGNLDFFSGGISREIKHFPGYSRKWTIVIFYLLVIPSKLLIITFRDPIKLVHFWNKSRKENWIRNNIIMGTSIKNRRNLNLNVHYAGKFCNQGTWYNAIRFVWMYEDILITKIVD